MSTKPVSATVAPWLRKNGMRLGGLTGQDWPALKAAVHVVELWTSSDYDGRERAAIAFRMIVNSMQPGTRHLAYHAIAHVADWSHRAELWNEAGLTPLTNPGRCINE